MKVHKKPRVCNTKSFPGLGGGGGGGGGGVGNYENGEENDHYVVPLTNDILQDIDHFKMLDDYYRYGLAFDNSDFYPDNILYIKDSHSVNKSDTIPFMVDEFYLLETLIKNDVKIINPNVCDTGENTLSDMKKWKRKVINKQSNRKTKLRLLNPNIYRSLITFIFFLTLSLETTINLIMI